MAHQVIKYRLTAEGTVPDFLCTEPNGFRGLYPVYDDLYSKPRNFVMVGVSGEDVTGDFEVVATEQALESYLSTVGADWYTYTDAYKPVETKPETWDVGKFPFDPAVSAAEVWANLAMLNAE